jgi:hypothetical protein
MRPTNNLRVFYTHSGNMMGNAGQDNPAQKAESSLP